MGLIINVYRRPDDYDCSLNGVSNQHTELTVVNVDGPFEPKSNRPAVALVAGNLPGTLKIVPAVKVDVTSEGPQWITPGRPMMGGNYGATSDSRFSEACEKLLGHVFYGAVPIHDRFED
jgi:hypothetical protein